MLQGCLCPLILIVEEIVLFGYRAQVSEELERDPEMKDHPDIKLDDLMVYLKRGLRTLGNTDEYIAKATGEWFFALALADPDSAKKLADRLLDSTKRSPNRFGGIGLVELGSIFTAPDRLKMLLSWSRLPARSAATIDQIHYRIFARRAA